MLRFTLSPFHLSRVAPSDATSPTGQRPDKPVSLAALQQEDAQVCDGKDGIVVLVVLFMLRSVSFILLHLTP
jgi:hypothetical protein